MTAAAPATAPAVPARRCGNCYAWGLGNGARLKLEGTTVLTVLPARRGKMPREHNEEGEEA